MFLRKRSSESFSLPFRSRLDKQASPGKVTAQRILLGMLVIVMVGGILFRAVTYFFDRRQAFSSTHVLLITPHPAGQPFRQLAAFIISQQKGYLVHIPDDRTVQTLGKFGQYPSRSLYELFHREKPNTRYLPVTVGYQLGYPLQETLTLPQPVEQAEDLKTVLSLNSILRAESTLDILDRFFLWEKIKTLQLSTVSYTDFILPSGELASPQNSDLTRSQLAFPRLLSRKVEIAILNGTENKGLATRFAQLAEFAGFRIIAVDKASAEVIEMSKNKSVLFVLPDTDINIIRDSLALFPVQAEVKKDAALVQKFRAHLVFVIGEEFLQ